MIIIPTIKTVVILVPRTGSGSLYRTILKRYPDAMMPYRHMEADGTPRGYDTYRRVGVVRHPVDRIWSLFKYVKKIVAYQRYLLRLPLETGDASYKMHPTIMENLKRSVEDSISFESYILHNQTVFPVPVYDVITGEVCPFRQMNHAIPENLKSQFLYLRPDLGDCKIFRYENQMEELYDLLDLPPSSVSLLTNFTVPKRQPKLSQNAVEKLKWVFNWEFSSIGYKL